LIRKIGKKDEDGDEEEDEGYVGAAVLDAMVGFYDEPVAVPDFRSLYPTTIIDGNMCITTQVKNPAYANIPGAQYNYVKVDDTKTHVFSMDYMGLIPEILIDLLLCRDKRKQMMEDAPPGSTERMIHNGAQLALKISANSIYGFFGVSPDKAMLPCMAIGKLFCCLKKKSI
jgi:DNA polymerase delta subunit 1